MHIYEMNDKNNDEEWMERIQQPECHDASIPIVSSVRSSYSDDGLAYIRISGMQML